MANSEDPDEMSHKAAFYQGLHPGGLGVVLSFYLHMYARAQHLLFIKKKNIKNF